MVRSSWERGAGGSRSDEWEPHTLELPRKIPNANSVARGFALAMKANDKNTKAFRLVDGKFCSSKWWVTELLFWLIIALATVFSKWLGWF